MPSLGIPDTSQPIIAVVPASKIYNAEHGYNSTLKAVDNSLERFQFGTLLRSVGLCAYSRYNARSDYLDLFLIHDPLAGKQKRLETWRALLEAKKAGKLRTVGVSN